MSPTWPVVMVMPLGKRPRLEISEVLQAFSKSSRSHWLFRVYGNGRQRIACIDGGVMRSGLD